jgi:CRISPR-associated protein (TIGR03986 family)
MTTKHISPNRPDRTATAPYNFIPLPNQCLWVEDGWEVDGEKKKPWENHHEFSPGLETGWVDVKIETLTPLFIRGPVFPGENAGPARDNRLRYEPFRRPDGTPVIPGSSLRGMTRNLLEILTFSRIKPITDAQPFFRTVGNDRIGMAYRNRMLRDGEKPPGGFLLKTKGKDAFIAPCEVLRVSRQKLPQHIFRGGPNYTPDWRFQQKPCWIKRQSADSDLVAEIVFQDHNHEPTGKGTWETGTLVLTGNAPKKKKEFVFLEAESDESKFIPVSEPIWERFQDKDQISQWQGRAFPKDEPTSRCRKADGHLRNGESVFFLTEENLKTEDNPSGLVFLGRAQMFRLPYDLGPADLVPFPSPQKGIDMAEAIFGRVSREEKADAPIIKGRVFFEDAEAISGGPNWTEEIIVPKILSSPSPTSFQHYLTQDGTQGKEKLTTYLKGDKTAVRGHKLYWHRWDENQGLRAIREPNQESRKRNDLVAGRAESHTQHTIIQPVKSKVTFKTRIRFQNLSGIELGALLSALQLPEGCAHKLGMGKPLGLGSVRLDSDLHLVDHAARYSSWETNGVKKEKVESYQSSFSNFILEHAQKADETLVDNQKGLRKIGRIDALFVMLEWVRRPGLAKTEYMGLGEFRERRVLPSPYAVAAANEPQWKGEKPRPAEKEKEAERDAAQPSKAEPEQPPAVVKKGDPVPIRKDKKAGAPSIQAGQTVDGKLEKSGEKWVAVLPNDDRPGKIENPKDIPADAKEGAVAQFFVRLQSKKKGIVLRFDGFKLP